MNSEHPPYRLPYKQRYPLEPNHKKIFSYLLLRVLIGFILTDMKKVIVSLDDELAKELAKSPNMSETVREALRVYNGFISTGVTTAMKQSFDLIKKQNQETKERLDLLYDMIGTKIPTQTNWGA